MFLSRLRETLYFFWHHLTPLLSLLIPVLLPLLLFINYRLFYVLDGNPEKVMTDGLSLLAQMLGGVAASALTIRYTLAVLGQRTTAALPLWQGALRRMPALFLVQLLAGALIVLGLLALILPGLYLMGVLLPAYVLVVHEEMGPVAALKSAWARFRPQAWALSAALAAILLGLVIVLSGLESLGGLLKDVSPPLRVLANAGLDMIGVLFSQMISVLLVRCYEIEVSSAAKP